MPSTITIEINGKPIQAESTVSIIEVADSHGIYIPRFCYHKKLSVAANCRMCLVEVEKAPKTLPACATPITAGMRVFTRSPKARAAQRAVMEFLLINHPLDCPICDQGGECELQDLALLYGSDHSSFIESKRAVQDEDFGSLIATDMTRCIQCTRCVRFATEIAGVKELGEISRGENMHIATYIQHSLQSELSGNIIDLCPVGALTSKPFRFMARAWELHQTASVSPHDCLGTNIYIHTRGQQVMRVVPQENETINETWISDRDRYAYAGLYHSDRSTQPMIKVNQKWQATDWATALGQAASGLQSILDSAGPHQIAALASPSSTTEELYLLQKLVRTLGCNNIDHRLHQTDIRDQTVAPLYPGAEVTLTELNECDCIILIGSNIQREQPLLAHRIRQASLRGARIMSVNCLDYDFHFNQETKIMLPPAQLPKILAMMARAGCVMSTPPWLKDIELDTLTRPLVVGLREAKKPVILLGAITQNHPEAALLRLLARFIADHYQASLFHLNEGANSAGAWLVGAIPHREIGGLALSQPGLSAYAMFQKSLKAYLLLHVEPDLDCAHPNQACSSLKKADWVVALTAFNAPSLLEYADVILPVAAFAETSGSFVNVEGRWQAFSAAVLPPTPARPAWKVLRVLANQLGLAHFEYETCEQVQTEAQNLVSSAQPLPNLTEAYLERLSDLTLDQPLTTYSFSHATSKSSGKELNGTQETKISFMPQTATLTRIAEWTLYAIDGLSRRSDPLQKAASNELVGVYLNPKLIDKLDLTPGQTVGVQQEEEIIRLPVHPDERIPYDCAWVPAGRSETSRLGESFGDIKIHVE